MGCLFHYFWYQRIMETQEALLAFSALSQTTRLDVFRLLIEHEPEGLPAGGIARRLAVPANTMSAHLGVLARARLVSAERRSRTIIYRAQIDSLRALIDFLATNCCGGRPDLCAALIRPLQSASCQKPENEPSDA
jgi:ArsR family transcriptional regulator